jgi:hypothetical protein
MSSLPLIHDLDNASQDPMQPKAIYAGDAWDGQPTLVLTEDEAILWADPVKGVIDVTAEFGVLLSGKLSLSASPQDISVGGGFWCLNPLLTTCLPSTTPTPIPTLVRTQPDVLKGASDMTSALGFLQSFSDFA